MSRAADLGRTALVTGASSGIGRSFARALAKRGLDVVAVARRKERLEELAAEIGTAHGRHVEVLQADLGEPSDLARVEGRLADPDRPVDVLVNSAAFITLGRFFELPVDTEQKEIELNVISLVRLSRAALPGMVERGHGLVINISSLAGHQPMPGWANYAATKAYVTSFSRALTSELRGTGVRVLTLMPGWTHTELQPRSDVAYELVPGPAWMTPEKVVKAALRAVDRGRSESIPGWHMRLVGVASRMSPWPLTREFLRLATRNKMW